MIVLWFRSRKSHAGRVLKLHLQDDAALQIAEGYSCSGVLRVICDEALVKNRY